jgi:CTP synthase (UTP-ammonia lyase)
MTTREHDVLTQPRIALVGDRSSNVRAHVLIPAILDALAERDQLVLDAYWISSDEAENEGVLDGFDAIWVLPGSPYRSPEGAIRAARTAREKGIPFLGTCGGFQHALLEYARNACGLGNVANAESDPDAPEQLIVPMECSLVGHEGTILIQPGTLAERVLGVDRSQERYHCSYGLSTAYLDVLREHGMVFSGTDEAGEVRIAELPGHPFYFVTLFQPELAGGTRPHPVISALAEAAHSSSLVGTR